MKDHKDRKGSIATKLALAGAGAGLGMFAIYGVINASFIGGLIGLNIAGVLSGFPVESALLSRGLVALGMLAGVLIAALMFVSAGATAGWLLGKLAEVVGHLSNLKRMVDGKDKTLAIVRH